MAKEQKHRAVARVGKFDLPKNTGEGIAIEIFDDDEKLGTFQLGQGSFRWKGKGAQKPKHVTWANFAARIKDL
jgi:hypothetical protein